MKNLHQQYPGNYFLLGKKLFFFLEFLETLISCVLNTYVSIGDSGYALRPWMLTPIQHSEEGSPESDYNDCQMAARSVVERVNGVLKMRFRCLLKHRVLHYKPDVASKIINTCCCLHNLCITNNIQDVLPEEGDDLLDGIFLDEVQSENYINQRINPLLVEGRKLQAEIVRKYFSTS